jgi:hypothetical protein
LDDGLTWKPHAIYTSQKIAKSVGILSRARKTLSKSTVLQLYFSFIYPYITYCNIAWGNAPSSTLWPIFRLQKIAIRLVANIKRNLSTLPFCKINNILRLPDIYQQSVGIFMFKFRNGLLPDIFNNFFATNNAAHRYPTRTGSQLRMPLARSMIASTFITKTGVTIWNNIDTHITGNSKIGTFKSKLNKFITLAYAP